MKDTNNNYKKSEKRLQYCSDKNNKIYRNCFYIKKVLYIYLMKYRHTKMNNLIL